MKIQQKRLQLHKETLRQLSAAQLAGVAGAGAYDAETANKCVPGADANFVDPTSSPSVVGGSCLPPIVMPIVLDLVAR
jgi:hypothetical protein